MPKVPPTATLLTNDRLAPGDDRARVDEMLAEAIAEARRAHAVNPMLGPLFDRMGGSVLQGGKRLRPRLCLASYRIVSGRAEGPPRPVWQVAGSLEVFHAFMLVHDDLIDGSTLRRDRPTLHESIRLDSDAPDSAPARKRAADLGLLAGDLLCALGHRMINRSGLDDAALGRVNRMVSDMLVETGLGEALDVLADDCPLDRMAEGPLVEAYLRKTARYTVSGPMVLGATMAGAGARVCGALDRFGDLLGFGYQVRNDLASIDEDPEVGDHSDLDGGKRTYVLWAAYQGLSPAGRRSLAESIAAPPSVDRRRRLLALIRESGAVDHCQSRLSAVQHEAVAALRSSDLTASQRRGFVALAEQFHLKGRPAPRVAPRPHAPSPGL